ncbi:MAG: amino acid adenylation domain-containing protein [Candidatus Binatia bacterium]
MTRLLQDGLSAQAQNRPEARAVVFRQESLSYGALEAESNRLARMLRAVGCKRGDRVALLIPKCPMAIVALQAVLKADAMYVPIDPAMPAVRAGKILRKSGARLVLAAGPVQPLLQETLFQVSEPVRVGWLDDSCMEGSPLFTLGDLAGYPETRVASLNTGSDGAHILFTSGSTGEPKGVLITHDNVLHFIQWAIAYFGLTAADRKSGHPPLHFDMSTFDVHGALTAGAELHLVEPELNLIPHKLAAFIRDTELTQWFSVPAILNHMARFDVVRQDDFPTLTHLVWAGEVFPTPALMYWMRRLPHVTFTNLYGPTETTISSSYYTVPLCPQSEEQLIPIGTPCPGEELLVLDEAQKTLPPEEIGEVYIGGVGVSPGYWEDPERTKAAFLPHPDPRRVGERIYKTGDLGKLGKDDLVYYLGRADSQIKSRGYRIELGEVEAALNALGTLVEVAVVGVKSSGFEGTVIGCAYVSQRGNTITPTALRQQLRKRLPSYMLPTRWMAVKELPKNLNGKIDRKKVQQDFENQQKLQE